MKNLRYFLAVLTIAILMSACGWIEFGKNVKTITPSDTIITDTRAVSGFTEINMSTIGKVTINQGKSDSLKIKGADNVVPLVKTSVSNGALTIRMDNNIIVRELNREDVLVFTITVKDLSSVQISGLAAVEMDGLLTKSLKLEMSGAGAIAFTGVSAESVNVNISGVGPISVAGTADQVNVEISGAGSVEAGDLQCQIANINISGMGSATVWATDELIGEISGGGNIMYYGTPTTDTKKSGVGKFEPLGDK